MAGRLRWLFGAGVAVALVGGLGAGAALARAEEGDRCISPSATAERVVRGFGYLAGFGIIVIGIAVGLSGAKAERRSTVRLVAAAVIVAVGISQLVVAYSLVVCDS